MSGKRDYYRYELKDGHGVVYIGITNDPARREQEHRSEGKVFDTMNVIRPAVTETTAREWEQERLKTYRSNHGGENPKYNR